MKKIEKMANLPVPTLEEIIAKGEEYKALIHRYANRVTKTTIGAQSMGPAGLKFAKKCQNKKDLFPEIVPGTFQGDDFDEKMEIIEGTNTIKIQLTEIDDVMIEPLKICKTDCKSHATDYYALIKKQAPRLPKYQTTFNELSPFFSKSKSEKVPVENPKNVKNTDSNTAGN